MVRRIFTWFLAIIGVAVVVAIVTVDSWLTLTWGERGQGDYPPRTAKEQAAAEERARAAEDEVIEAVDRALEAIEGAKRAQEEVGRR